MFVEYKELNIEELVKITGLSVNEVIQATQNLVDLRLISVEPVFKSVPKFKILNEEEAQKFINVASE